jgi:hypothetical protein
MLHLPDLAVEREGGIVARGREGFMTVASQRRPQSQQEASAC